MLPFHEGIVYGLFKHQDVGDVGDSRLRGDRSSLHRWVAWKTYILHPSMTRHKCVMLFRAQQGIGMPGTGEASGPA